MPSVPAKREEKAEEAGGMEALHLLKSVSPPLFLSPSPSLSQSARSASTFLFSSLLPACPKSPFDRLLVEGFDAEQIWQQIDLQTRPLIANLRREIKRFETSPSEITKIFGGETLENDKQANKEGSVERNEREEGIEKEDEENESFDEENGGIDEEDEDEEDDGEEEEEEGHGGRGGIEDGFLKLEELEEFLEKEEAREYEPSKEKHRNWDASDEEDGDNDEAEEDEEEGDMNTTEGIGEDGSKGADNYECIRYEDFYGSKNKKGSKKAKSFDRLDEMISDDDKDFDNKDKGALSTHEKRLQKIHSTIEKMEKENLETKHWTMQGEVTANKRPKNSALEVDLDFERNVRPPPVITEEVAASLEELIKKRIIEGHFDNVQRAPSLPSKAPKELKELDENKSLKGLAEIYEEEFMQRTGLTSAPLSFSDELKKEASLLFKKLCVKLDALSHFHFTPKPVIEDMSIQANVPALAMEEIAPLAVSDAAMLAPEEVFAGKGEIKEDAELTQEERKRRRAKKKRKFKAETTKRMAAKKARENAVLNHSSGKDES